MPQFPSAIPSYAGFTGSHTLSADNHAAQSNAEQGDTIAIATKVGTGSSTPTTQKLLRGTGTGTSAWAQADLTTDVTGVLAQANGGTGTTQATGTGKAVYDTSPTIITPVIASFATANHNHQNSSGGGTLTGAALQTNTVAYSNLALGVLVQVAETLSSDVATGTTVIPSDDTIPQNTEGDQYMSVSITPKSVTNTLIIDVLAMVANSTVQILSGAIFQDATVSAIAAAQTTAYLTGAPAMLTLRYKMVAGTVSPTTFNFRAGTQGTGTLTFNGISGGRIFGATPKSSMTVWEYNS